MTNDLLKLINRKNDMYRDWKSTNDETEYSRKKINFKTFDKIVDKQIIDAKCKYYHNTFMAQKSDMKKTWATINETLNRKKNKTDYPPEFIVDENPIKSPTDISNQFNTFFANIGTNLSQNIEQNNGRISYSDYLDNPAASLFNFSSITEDDIISIITKFKNKTSSGHDGMSNKLLKSIKATLAINQEN